MSKLKSLALLVLALSFASNSTDAGVITNFQYLAAVGSHEKGNFPEAAKKFEKLLTASDPAVSGHAAYQLFEYYFNGAPGIPQSHVKALPYLELAYQSRDQTWFSLAANMKGMLFHFGVERLVEVDRVAAYKYYRESADKNSSKKLPNALQELTRYPDVYVNLHPELFRESGIADDIAPGGIDTAITLAQKGDNQNAMKIFRWHAKRGDDVARTGLVLALQASEDANERAEMMGWVYLSAKNGKPEAQMWYGAFLLEETKAYTAEGFSWIERAASQGNAAAENLLALYNFNGIRDFPPNRSIAIKRFEHAVELGSTVAMVNLGDLYFEGNGVSKNTDIALDLYKRAAGMGDVTAADRLSKRFGLAPPSIPTATAASQSAPNIASSPATSRISRAEILIDKRVALVIGNAAYERAPLKNPVNDSRLMASELKNARFKVFQVENGSLEEIYQAIDRFTAAIPVDGVAVVYYAGHGVQVNGENYLIPVGVSLTSETDAKYKAINLGFILSKLEDARSRVNVVILDACRDNPFSRSWRSQRGGLAAIDAPAGTMIAFSTAPGQVASDGEGGNGLFTGELVKELRKPNQKIEDILKNTRRAVSEITSSQQVPWDSSSLMGNFYFNVSE